MVLVDSSVWIDLLRDVKSAPVQALRQMLSRGEAALAPVIYQELLQGAASPAGLLRLKEYFGTLTFLLPLHPIRSAEAAAELYARCRWKGITPRGSSDCLVAQTAIEHDVRLLHDDGDFVALAKVAPRLKLYPPEP